MVKKTDDENRSYEELVTTYENLVEIAITFSDASGGIQTSKIGIEATKIYTRLTLSSMTINSLIPENKLNKKTLWDFPSVAVLGRTYLETSHRYLYLAEPGLDDSEKRFRFKLFYYHMNSEKYKLYKDIDPNSEILKKFKEKLPKARKELTQTKEFSTLSKYKANKIKKGYMAIHLTDDEMARKFLLSDNHFSSIYRLLSNHSHGTPFSTFTQTNERGRGFENETEKMYLKIVLELLSHYLSKVITTQAELLNLQHINPNGLKYAKKVFERSYIKKPMGRRR